MKGESVHGTREDLHSVLAGWLVQREGPTPADVVARYGMEAVLDACEREGVVSVVYARLSDVDSSDLASPEFMQALATRARLCAARSLLCVSEARKIQVALAGAGVPAIWLKGIALGQWLYSSMHLRDVADIDLLLPDHATTLRAAEVLAPLGYALPNPHIAGDLVVHELLAWSERAQLELDLHWDLSNDALFAGRLSWQALHADAIELPALSATARGLAPRHALLHAVVHRAANYRSGREDRLRWLYDLHLLAGSLTGEVWQQLVEDAATHRVAGPALDGLQAIHATFGTAVPAAILSDLRAAAAREFLQCARLRSWGYFQWSSWRALPGLSTRLRWLRQLLLPDMAHLRVRYGGDGASGTRVVTRRIVDGWQRWRSYHRGLS